MTSPSHKRSPLVSGMILLIAIGLVATYSSFFYGATSDNNSAATILDTTVDTSSDTTATKNGIIYTGKDNIDALTLLKEGRSVDASAEGFVNSINGVKPAEKQYWAFYINGDLSMTGAKETITKNGDSIEWKLVGY